MHNNLGAGSASVIYFREKEKDLCYRGRCANGCCGAVELEPIVR
ncbi:MAG: hypothetical protein JWO35_226 [Candidatus Saccharibacteria bacterium]|nr:hypothetical protein [Candidatus Saccharibacteria bacterium]